MQTTIKKINKGKSKDNILYLVSQTGKLKEYGFSQVEISFINDQVDGKDKKLISFNRYSHWEYVQFIKKEKEANDHLQIETCRKDGDKFVSSLNSQKLKEITICDAGIKPAELLAFVEGMALGNYQFLKYISDQKKLNSLKSISVLSNQISASELNELSAIVDGTCKCRDLVNEPLSNLDADALADIFKEMGKEGSIKVEVFYKAKIETLKMGGLLSVNKGSPNPPTFTVMEWKPENHINKKPYIIVGKGIVFDTGGINLKTSTGLQTMKCDMGGAAAAGCIIYVIAKQKLPVWVISLMPATENRPDGNAMVPGDVITISDGTTVEVQNTDAEGRLILADALVFAKKYKPELVIDIATLTGSASAAIGPFGIVAMGSGYNKQMEKLKESGDAVHERIAEFPFWEDYKDLIKSEVADIRNTSGQFAGAIGAGKFLEHFVDYPWIHLDIAGPVFLDHRDSYRGMHATGVCVRLVYDFLKKKI